MGVKSPVKRQILSSVCGNLLTASYGSSSGWASANFLALQRLDTTFPSGPLTVKEATLVMSISLIGGLVGNFIFPYIVQRYGSKRTMMAIGWPQIVSQLLIIYAQNPYYLYTSRAISGIVGAGQLISMTIFVTEISHDKVRGSLNSLFDPAFNLGTLLAYVIANYFNYADQAKFHVILPIVYEILFSRIPQSPQHLVNMQKEEAAKKSHTFFKGTEIEKFPLDASTKTTSKTELTLNDFVNRRARKAILIVLSLVVLSSTQGFFLLVAYVTEIFESTSSNLTAIESSIVITSILIVGNLIVFNIIDRVGRRILYLSSSVFTTLALITFAIYLRTFADNTALAWVPIVSVSFIIFVSSLGMIPVPFLVMVEILPKKIQHYGITAFIGTQYTIVFLMCEAYPPLKAHIGLFGWIVFFIVMCVGNIVFAIFVVPETKGKSHDVIMQMLD